MPKKIHSILLIDDDADCNFFHEKIIRKMDLAEELHFCKNGKEAIEFLKKEENGQHAHPDIIFLDINMPLMNGWEFMEEYQKLNEQQKAKIVIVMLTTSLNPHDLETAKKYKDIKGYKNKYLTQNDLRELLESYFT